MRAPPARWLPALLAVLALISASFGRSKEVVGSSDGLVPALAAAPETAPPAAPAVVADEAPVEGFEPAESELADAGLAEAGLAEAWLPDTEVESLVGL